VAQCLNQKKQTNLQLMPINYNIIKNSSANNFINQLLVEIQYTKNTIKYEVIAKHADTNTILQYFYVWRIIFENNHISIPARSNSVATFVTNHVTTDVTTHEVRI
jgi:hypothetical protein